MIHWGDETGISNQDQIGRPWAPKGRTPVMARTAKRITRSMIAAISNRGLMRFMLYQGALNVDRFLTFLRRLVKDAGRKVFLIVDNPKVHHAAAVKAWVASHSHEIELFHLPACTPDHNASSTSTTSQGRGGGRSPTARTSWSGAPVRSCARSNARPSPSGTPPERQA